jgi:hypothetical protein
MNLDRWVVKLTRNVCPNLSSSQASAEAELLSQTSFSSPLHEFQGSEECILSRVVGVPPEAEEVADSDESQSTSESDLSSDGNQADQATARLDRPSYSSEEDR